MLFIEWKSQPQREASPVLMEVAEVDIQATLISSSQFLPDGFDANHSAAVSHALNHALLSYAQRNLQTSARISLFWFAGRSYQRALDRLRTQPLARVEKSK
jgi:hypothetical protein